ncbi:MAG TPA: hypothetical protein VN703_00225 [Candidatus Sulfopaludibacter sp.]|nr:hypothetical protein [Candidatus Sulfopaludibacter sp.]
MSLNVSPTRVVKVMDPRLKLSNERVFAAIQGGRVISGQTFPATVINNSSLAITCNPPSRGVAISRRVRKRFRYDISITGTNTGGGPLLNPGYYGPRNMPIAMTTISESWQLENDTVTQQPIQQYAQCLQWYHNDFDVRNREYGESPSMLDQFQNYADGANSIRNPLGGYGDNSYETTRAGFSQFQVLTNPVGGGGGTATLTLICTEDTYVSPFVFGKDSEYSSALVGINNMTYTATFGNLANVMSLVQNQGVPGVVNITAVTVDLKSAELLFNYITPQITETLPSSLVSPYFSPILYPFNYNQTIAPGGSVSITLGNVQVTSIPQRMYIFAGPAQSAKTPYISDSYMALSPIGNPIQLTWNNNQYLSSMTAQQLYDMSIKNGLRMSWTQFSNFVGSIVCIEFGTDIGLDANEAIGTLGNYQLNVTANFINTNSSLSIVPTLYVLVVSSGTFNVVNGACSHMLGVLSSADVLNAQVDPNINYQKAESAYGGAFFDSLKKGLSKLHQYAKDKKLISKGLAQFGPKGKVASEIAEKLGYGVVAGRMPKKRSLASRLKGRGIENLDENESESDEYSEE